MAGLSVSIQSDVKRAQRFYKELSERQIDRAASNGLNVVIREVRKESIDEVAKVRKLKKSAIRKGIRLVQRASNYTLRAVVQAFGRPISLKDYGAKQTPLGVEVNVEGKKKLIPHAFGPGYKARGRGKKLTRGSPRVLGGHVYMRTGESRLPIEKKWGPSIPTGFIREVVRTAQRRVIATRWPIVFRDKLEDQLRKLRAKYGG